MLWKKSGQFQGTMVKRLDCILLYSTIGTMLSMWTCR